MLRPDTFALTLLLASLTGLGPMSADLYVPSLPDISHPLHLGHGNGTERFHQLSSAAGNYSLFAVKEFCATLSLVSYDSHECNASQQFQTTD